MKSLQEIWNVSEEKVNVVAEYPFKLRGYNYKATDLEAFKFMCQKTGTDPRQGEIYPQFDGYRFVPTLTSDGWLRVANQHPEFDGMSIDYSDKEVSIEIGEAVVIGAEYVEVTVHRKDRTHQSSVREYLRETFNPNNLTHFTHPNRNTRHKAIAQAVKIAFGISGAYVQGEADELRAAAPSNGPTQGAVETQSQPAAEKQQNRPRVQTKPLDNPPPVKVVTPKTEEVEAEPKTEVTADKPAVTNEEAKAETETDNQQVETEEAQPEKEPAQEAETPQVEPEAEKPATKEEVQVTNTSDEAVSEFEPTADQQQKLERFLQFTQASGHFDRAREFLKGGIKDADERAWYSYHLEQLIEEVSHA